MNAFRSSLAVLGCLIMLALGASASHAASCPAGDTVMGAANAFLNAAQSGSNAAFTDAVGRYADVDNVAMFALGKYRRDLPEDRRSEYVKNAQRYMGAFLARYGDRFKGSSLSIKSCKGNVVETSVKGGDDILWKVSGSRVMDVKVSGFWLTIQLRKKFTDIIQQGNRRVEALLDLLARS